MVKCDKGTTEISGTKSQILAEFTMIVRSMRDCEHINDEEIKRSYDRGFLTDEEIKRSYDRGFLADEEITGLMADKLADILAKIAERMKEGDESGDD